MDNTLISRYRPAFLVWPVALGAIELWSWFADGEMSAVMPGAAIVVLAAVVGMARLSQARVAKRFQAALDAYAEREIDRQRHRNELEDISSTTIS